MADLCLAVLTSCFIQPCCLPSKSRFIIGMYYLRVRLTNVQGPSGRPMRLLVVRPHMQDVHDVITYAKR